MTEIEAMITAASATPTAARSAESLGGWRVSVRTERSMCGPRAAAWRIRAAARSDYARPVNRSVVMFSFGMARSSTRWRFSRDGCAPGFRVAIYLVRTKGGRPAA